MGTDEIIKRCKPPTRQGLADLLGITPQAVSAWQGVIPPLRLYQLRALRPRWFIRGIK